MLKKFFNIFLGGVLFSGCAKEYSCENCIPPLTINCAGIVVNGDYVKGTALSTANHVSLPVKAGQPGPYYFSTGMVNGVSFKDSGTLAAPGQYTITLDGSGIPADTGTFNYQVANCSFTITFRDAVMSIDTFFYEATIDGIFYKETVTATSGYEAVSFITVIAGGTDTATFKAGIRTITQPSPAGKTGFFIFKGWFNDYSTCTNAQFKAYFNPGNYPFGHAGNTTPQGHTTSGGILILWNDETGKVWHSDYSTNQAGRSFAITSVADYRFSPLYSVKVRAQFNCLLYDNFGNSKTLTNGKFYGYFEKR